MEPYNSSSSFNDVKSIFTSIDFFFSVIFEGIGDADWFMSENREWLTFKDSVNFESFLPAETHSSGFCFWLLEE